MTEIDLTSQFPSRDLSNITKEELIGSLELCVIWVRAALECKAWHWDPDQWAAADHSCREAQALLDRSRI